MKNIPDIVLIQIRRDLVKDQDRRTVDDRPRKLNAPRLAQRRHDLGISYYALYPERWANHLGKLVLKRPSMGQALID